MFGKAWFATFMTFAKKPLKHSFIKNHQKVWAYYTFNGHELNITLAPQYCNSLSATFFETFLENLEKVWNWSSQQEMWAEIEDWASFFAPFILESFLNLLFFKVFCTFYSGKFTTLKNCILFWAMWAEIEDWASRKRPLTPGLSVSPNFDSDGRLSPQLKNDNNNNNLTIIIIMIILLLLLIIIIIMIII